GPGVAARWPRGRRAGRAPCRGRARATGRGRCRRRARRVRDRAPWRRRVGSAAPGNRCRDAVRGARLPGRGGCPGGAVHSERERLLGRAWVSPPALAALWACHTVLGSPRGGWFAGVAHFAGVAYSAGVAYFTASSFWRDAQVGDTRLCTMRNPDRPNGAILRHMTG